MKTKSRSLLLAALTLIAAAPALKAQLVIPSDGSDGDLIVATNTVIDLSKAVTGSWDANNDANKGKGIYDSNKWAVVFKYSSVTISNGATLSFANHASRAPVVWLVKSNAIIDGILSLKGQNYVLAPALAEPGPGGFRGGMGNYSFGADRSSGFGPGGGGFHPGDGRQGAGGSYGSRGSFGPSPYGNPSMLPLIGGSGGGGTSVSGGPNNGGGGGGGAILVACSGTISVKGSIRANGGNGTSYLGSGSGGGIRLVASSLTGTGTVEAIGGVDASYTGGVGRIRIESVSSLSAIQVTPDPSVVPLQAAATPLIWLPSDGPTARIVSIGVANVPADPRASFGTFGPDVTLPQVSTTPVVIETTNAEPASIVTVRVSPRANGDYTETTAKPTQTNSTNPLVIRWLANVPVNVGYSAVQVKVVRP